VVKRRRRRAALSVTGDGNGVANHAGARLLAELADVVGLTSAVSAAMAPTKQRRRGHDRGEVLIDLAVAIADGAETISDLATLRDQPDLFGQVASHPTVWRALAAVDEAALERIKTARAQARANAWAAGADPGFYVIDIDATLVGAHSDKEQAAPTWKRGFGFHPLLAYLDATGEALAGVLRPGNAGSGTATDHVRGACQVLCVSGSGHGVHRWGWMRSG
jgi:Transposase DDE domain group 1